MTVKQLIEYLGQFDGESAPVILAVNPEKRVKYTVHGTILITDKKVPVIGLELGGTVPFDQEEVQAAEQDEEETVR